MRILRVMMASAAALAVTLAIPVSPAQAVPAPDVQFSVSCGRVTAISSSSEQAVVYYGPAELDPEMMNSDGVILLDQYEVGTIATTRSTLYLTVLTLRATDLSPFEVTVLTVPQNCTGVSAAVLTITGNRRVGNTLTAKMGKWVPAPLLYSFQWYRNGKQISGANDETYKLVGADRGKHIKVKVNAVFVGYAGISRTSKATSKVKAGILTTKRPTITTLGWTATATPGAWTPAPVTLKYQWFLGSKRIKGATAATFVIPTSYVGKQIRVRVTGTKAGYTPVVRFSKRFRVTGVS